MRWRDVAQTVGKAAPAVGAALAGPGGAVVGNLAARALGVEASPDAVAQAIHRDPEAATKLAEIEAESRRALIDAQARVITAEAQGEGWLQRSWRPIVMLWLAALVGAHFLGFTPSGLSEAMVLKLFDIVQYGLAGYVAGRSAEKIAKTVTGTGVAGTFMDRLKDR